MQIQKVYTVRNGSMVNSWAMGRYFTQHPPFSQAQVVELKLKIPLEWPGFFSNRRNGTRASLDRLLFTPLDDTWRRNFPKWLQEYREDQRGEMGNIISHSNDDKLLAFLSIPLEVDQLLHRNICECGCGGSSTCKNSMEHRCDCCIACAWPQLTSPAINAVNREKGVCYSMPLEIIFVGKKATPENLFEGVDEEILEEIRHEPSALVSHKTRARHPPPPQTMEEQLVAFPGIRKPLPLKDNVNPVEAKERFSVAVNLYITAGMLLTNLLYPCESYFRKLKNESDLEKIEQDPMLKYAEGRRQITWNNIDMERTDFYPAKTVHNRQFFSANMALYESINEEMAMNKIKLPFWVKDYLPSGRGGSFELLETLISATQSGSIYNRSDVHRIMSNLTQTTRDWVEGVLIRNARESQVPDLNQLKKEFKELKPEVELLLSKRKTDDSVAVAQTSLHLQNWVKNVLRICDFVVSDVFCWAVEILTDNLYTVVELVPLWLLCESDDLLDLGSFLFPLYDLLWEEPGSLTDRETDSEICKAGFLPFHPKKIPAIFKWINEKQAAPPPPKSKRAQKKGGKGTSKGESEAYHRIQYLPAFFTLFRSVYPDFSIKRIKEGFVNRLAQFGKGLEAKATKIFAPGEKKQDKPMGGADKYDYVEQLSTFHLLQLYQASYMESCVVEYLTTERGTVTDEEEDQEEEKEEEEEEEKRVEEPERKEERKERRGKGDENLVTANTRKVRVPRSPEIPENPTPLQVEDEDAWRKRLLREANKSKDVKPERIIELLTNEYEVQKEKGPLAARKALGMKKGGVKQRQ